MRDLRYAQASAIGMPILWLTLQMDIFKQMSKGLVLAMMAIGLLLALGIAKFSIYGSRWIYAKVAQARGFQVRNFKYVAGELNDLGPIQQNFLYRPVYAVKYDSSVLDRVFVYGAAPLLNFLIALLLFAAMFGLPTLVWREPPGYTDGRLLSLLLPMSTGMVFLGLTAMQLFTGRSEECTGRQLWNSIFRSNEMNKVLNIHMLSCSIIDHYIGACDEQFFQQYRDTYGENKSYWLLRFHVSIDRGEVSESLDYLEKAYQLVLNENDGELWDKEEASIIYERSMVAAKYESNKELHEELLQKAIEAQPDHENRDGAELAGEWAFGDREVAVLRAREVIKKAEEEYGDKPMVLDPIVRWYLRIVPEVKSETATT